MSGSGATRPARVLTTRAIETLMPEAAAYRVPDARCPGLAVRVASSGVRTWDLSYRVRQGGVRRMSLGRVDDLPLAAARERAGAITSAARLGRDLIAEEAQAREAAEARVTVAELIDRYVKRRVAGRLRTASEIESRLKRALAPVLERKAEDLRRRDLRDLFDAVADAGTTREAEKRRQVVGAMFRWALSVDLVEVDPAHGLPSYDAGQPRERVLSDEEIRTLWKWLGECGMVPSFADALRVQLAIGARIGEVGGMRAEEIDTKDWVWTLPAARSKNGRPRATPLVGIAREIVADRLRENPRGPLFPNEVGKATASHSVGVALGRRRDRCPIAHFTSHDLRRTAATEMAEMGVSLETVAAILGHDAGGARTRTLSRHYIHGDRLDEKRRVLMAWDARLKLIVFGPTFSGEGAGNVVGLKSRRAA